MLAEFVRMTNLDISLLVGSVAGCCPPRSREAEASVVMAAVAVAVTGLAGRAGRLLPSAGRSVGIGRRHPLAGFD